MFLYRLSILINVFYKKNLEKEYKNICLVCIYLVVNTIDIIYKWGNVFSWVKEVMF